MLEADFVERASDRGPSLGQRFALRLRRRLPSGGPVITRPSGIVAGHSPHAGGRVVGITVAREGKAQAKFGSGQDGRKRP